MAASVDEIPIDRKLDDIFEEAYNLYTGFDDCVDPTNGTDFQVCNKFCDAVEIMTHYNHNQTYLFSSKKLNNVSTYSKTPPNWLA